MISLSHILILVKSTKGTTSVRSAHLQRVHKQLYCDVISSYSMLDFLGCASQCLNDVDDCEGIALENNRSISKGACNVCFVKAVTNPMKPFTVPSGDARIYRRVIDMGKGKLSIVYAKKYCTKIDSTEKT